ncbi:protein of unknown function [Pseudodesulfovibrio profundus]|uniref:Uncharacterized protein n=1 Tax=Pseudodesulfovibrio profundus TaxID=57320 RepID=A0A2C8FAW2_9BACT|nr:hypothetical protein [Pseudodesulfovibrio profundus]SOB59641.1 protein of unknown function [Pseudodesulfovibrio profundus]
MHVFAVTTHLDHKDPKEQPLIIESLVIADSLEQLVTKYPRNRERKEWIHERIVEIRLLGSDKSSAAPMPLLNISDEQDRQRESQGQKTVTH